MPLPLRILLVEDSAADALLAADAMERAGLHADVTRVETAAAMVDALAAKAYDLVLADHSLPGFSGPEALEILQASGQDLPFILITGTLDSEAAARILLAGASDYVLKSDLAHLASTVQSALEARRERAAAREAAQRSSILQQAVEQTASMVFVTDLRGDIVYVNPRFSQVTGYAPREVIGRNPRLLQSGNTPAAVYQELWGTVMEGRTWKGELQNRRKDGSIYWVSATISPVRAQDASITHFVAIQEDITRQRQTLAQREALGELREAFLGMTRAGEFDAVLQQVPRWLGQLGVDHSACLVTVFSDAGAVATCRRIDLQDAPVTGLSDAARQRLGQVWRDGGPARARALATGVAPDLPVGQVPVATVVDVPFSQGVLTIAGPRPEALGANELPLLQRTATILSIGFRRHEDLVALESKEEQLRLAQRMESIGQLAGGIAHDFNNLLTVITGYAQVLARHQPVGSRQSESVERIATAANRATALVAQLLAFGRRQLLQPEVLDLNAIVERLAEMLSRLIGEDIEFVFRPGEDLVRVSADPSQIEQVIVNLAVNARDAMPDGGRLSISTSNARLDSDYADRRAEIVCGDYVLLEVSDTGSGMDLETQSRAFEPFFTTKPEGRGTGLGLSTVYGIVKQSGGYIWLYSEPGQGTTFKIYLPLAEGPLTPATAGPTPPAATGQETVLLAEDEELIRDLARQVLEEQGYTVLLAADGDAAIAAAAAHEGPIDILVTDLVLPGIGGVEVAERLRQSRPGTAVLFTSGYTGHSSMDRVRRDGSTAFMPKPFTPNDLVARVRQVLDGSST